MSFEQHAQEKDLEYRLRRLPLTPAERDEVRRMLRESYEAGEDRGASWLEEARAVSDPGDEEE